jgi:hypothetical protein
MSMAGPAPELTFVIFDDQDIFMATIFLLPEIPRYIATYKATYTCIYIYNYI